MPVGCARCAARRCAPVELREVPTIDGVRVSFQDLWEHREIVHVTSGLDIAIPSLDDLIATKRFAARPKDAEDIRMLEVLRSTRGT